jgi:predicted transcriptional regulator YheO
MKNTFSSLKKLAEAVVAMFGRNCEVAIHDLSDLDHSLIFISGNVTARSVGAPATDLLIKALRKDPEEIQDLYNYKTTTRDGRSIKSTTIFLRDDSGKIFAAFCINIDTTDFFTATQVLAPFVNMHNAQENTIQETFATSAAETIEVLFQQGLVNMGKQPASMTTREKIQLVKLLEEQGLFQMKGAVNRVAELSGVSKFTIYNYLKIIRNSGILIDNGGTDENSCAN